MKTCTSCGETKEFIDFQKRKASNDGFTASCKACLSLRDAARTNKKERIKKVSDRVKRLRKEKDKKNKVIDNNRTKSYRAKHPEKYKATNKVNNALRSGKLVRPDNCEKCGCACKPQGHHHSYEEVFWLDVTWLCVPCHNKEHEDLRILGIDPDIT